MIAFDNNESGYLDWVKENPDAYVLNAPKTRTGYPNRLHRANCKTIQTPARTNYTTTTYKKICSYNRETLEIWAKADPNGFDSCGLCKP